MRDCSCDRPRDHATVNPGFRDGWCATCGGYLNPDWLSTSQGLNRFLQRAGADHLAGAHCYSRELAGRAEFGLAYLTRDNPAEGMEEAADGMIYSFLESLKDRRAGEPEVDFDLLDAARHFALAHEALVRRRGRVRP